jgi:hypothetical protein
MSFSGKGQFEEATTMRLSANHRDLAAGLLFMTFGALGLWFGRAYEFGSASRMGPGYFPMTLSALLLVVGLITAARALRSSAVAIEWGSPRPIFCVLAGVLAFALLLEPAGFAVASLVLIALGYAGGWRFRILEFIVMYAVLLASCHLLFVKLLGMPLKLIPEF